MHRTATFILAAAFTLHAAEPWLTNVAPIVTPAEKKTYLSLASKERAEFEENFWSTRSIEREEYYRRLAYIDSKFGSSKRGSGANTDPGRIYLSLGAPNKVTRIPSSRIFVPLEIWYYDAVPGILNTELRLVFYQPNSVGLPKLYSPTTDTVRALLLPEASAVHMFGPNDSVTESDMRRNLITGPAEDEVITAAAGIATGVKYSGNDEILGQITSPEYMLSKLRPVKVTSRLITSHPPLDVLQTPSPYGGSQVDLRLTATAQKLIGVEIVEGFASLYQNRLTLHYAKPEPLEYTHRLDLLPGSYRLMITLDSTTYAYPLDIAEKPVMSEILRADSGRSAFVSLPQPGNVKWMIRQSGSIVWRESHDAGRIATIDLPTLSPGAYKIEAVTATEARSADLVMPIAATPKTTAISFNENLAPARRLAFMGHQWLLRGDFAKARQSLADSVGKGDTREARIELARAEALSGDLDTARETVRALLAKNPKDFEALATFAYIETKFQDYPVAAELYRKALAVQDSPALRMALQKLPTQ
jgi:GWxTD domain-containing protein